MDQGGFEECGTDIELMDTISHQEFETLVEAAVNGLPPSLAAYLDNVVIDIEDHPDRQTLGRLDRGDAWGLLGLYCGVPLTQRHVEAPPPMPDRIIIYRRNVLASCRSREEVIEQVRTTVLHEIGHYFGLDEEDLKDVGFD